MKLAIVFLLFFPVFAHAELNLTSQLNRSERQNMLEILGYGTATKILDDPYPLGGYSGVSIGLAHDIIKTSEAKKKGGADSQQSETSFLQLTLGKGLYNNVDLFVEFAPGHQEEQISSFGGALRWGFYEAEYLPITLSAQLASNSTSFQNQIDLSTQTLDLIASFSIQDVSLYLGGGTVRAAGTFMGGATGITDTQNVENETVSNSRFFTGLALKFSPVFVAFEVDRVTQANYGVKIGVRF